MEKICEALVGFDAKKFCEVLERYDGALIFKFDYVMNDAEALRIFERIEDGARREVERLRARRDWKGKV